MTFFHRRSRESAVPKIRIERQRSKSLHDLRAFEKKYTKFFKWAFGFLIIFFRLEERQKEEETLRHQIRKVSEEKSILHDRLDQLKKDFLELNPRKDQKARVDAAYEKQKGKLKQKIAHLEKKKAQLENKLRQPSEMDVSKRDHMRGSSDANSNSLIDFDASDPTLDFTASETSLNNHSSLTNKNSNLSLASMDSKSVGGSSEPDNLQFNAHISHEQLAELVAQLQSYKEYFEEIAMKKLEQKQVSNQAIAL